MRAVGLVGVAAMVAALAYGFVAGDFGAEGRELVSLPWGVVSLVDIYTGVFLFGSWIAWREASIVRAGPWLVALVVLGNFAAALYLLVAFRPGDGVAAIGRRRAGR